MLQLLIIAAATATLAMTLGRSNLSEKFRPPLPNLLEELITCPYCFSHWIAACLVLIYAREQFFLNWLAVVAFAQIFIIPINMMFHADSSQT